MSCFLTPIFHVVLILTCLNSDPLLCVFSLEAQFSNRCSTTYPLRLLFTCFTVKARMYLHMHVHTCTCDITRSNEATNALVNPDKITLKSHKHSFRENLDDLLLFKQNQMAKGTMLLLDPATLAGVVSIPKASNVGLPYKHIRQVYSELIQCSLQK